MLDYDIHTDGELSPLRKEHMGEGELINPFPGLRPFSMDESHLFFGREGHTDELLLKLAKNRFVAVMGFSGSGKSSLLYCGLVPVLYGGFVVDRGADWKIISVRPGTEPLENLAEGIISCEKGYSEYTEKEVRIKKSIATSILRAGPNGISELTKFVLDGPDQNFFILIDQFEELFRYKDNKDRNIQETTTVYVDLLLQAIKQQEVPVYIAITMRSDYIGECAQFSGLTQIINDSNYLVPQMTRKQKRIAIEGPIAVGGGRISRRLVKKLLTDIGDNQDQLPVMQHAMMRTWNYWLQYREKGEPIDIRHYNAVGRISEALSLHANEAYDELSENEKKIAEKMFKSLTEKTGDNLGVRKAVKLKDIAAIAATDETALVKVIDCFRKPGRSLLMPMAGTALHGESLIEISHESLMRIWNRLKTWVQEEYESSQMYKRISLAAAMYQIGKTGLWRPPDLQLALNWQKKQMPTRLWAKRYDDTFERAIVFLDTSRVTYEAEQKNQEMLQKRLLSRAKVVAIVFGALAVISVVFFLLAVNRQLQAEENYRLAEENKEKAEQEKLNAIAQEKVAEQQTLIALEKKEDLEKANLELENALLETETQKNRAEQKTLEALYQKSEAERAEIIAEENRALANDNSKFALEQASRADRLYFLQLAQAMSVKSLQLEDDNLKGLLAKQAYEFNEEYTGKKFDPYIYDGLYYALSHIDGRAYNTVTAHRNAVKTLTFDREGAHYYSSGSDGKIMKSDFLGTKGKQGILIDQNNFSNKILKIDQVSGTMLVASDSSYLQIYNINAPDKAVRKVRLGKGGIRDIVFSPDNRGFYALTSEKKLWYCGHDLNSPKVMDTFELNVQSMAISPTGNALMLGSEEGHLMYFDLRKNTLEVLLLEHGNPIHSLEFNPSASHIAIGDEKGVLKLWNTELSKVQYFLKGHKSRINDVAFSPDGNMLASASFDGTIQVWLLDDIDALPLTFKDNDSFVWDIEFHPSSDYILAGCDDGEIRIWPTGTQIMADELCEKLKRNMSREEWKKYVGKEREWMETCENLTKKDE